MAIPIPNLPLEIGFEILIRLPIKSLLRFRCVSKSWRSLISDPQFVKSHLNRSLLLNHQRVFISAYPPQFILCNVLGLYHDNDDAIGATKLDCLWGNPNSFIEILGSCNGLILLTVDTSRMIILNPSTRNYKELPPFPEIEGYKPGNEFFYGFGCDSSVHNYKVVISPSSSSGLGDTRFMVFSLKENSWRTQNLSLGGGSFVEDVGVSLNGALHWLGVRGTGFDRVNVIITLDLSEEVFHEMLQPPFPDDNTIGFCGLCVFEGCLCVLSDNLGISFNVWMMKEYGVRSSWIKLVTVPREMGTRHIHYLEPLCFWKNGEVVLNIDGREVASYNIEEKTFTSLVIHRYPNWFDAALYVESLLSPDGVSWNDEQLQALEAIIV